MAIAESGIDRISTPYSTPYCLAQQQGFFPYFKSRSQSTENKDKTFVQPEKAGKNLEKVPPKTKKTRKSQLIHP